MHNFLYKRLRQQRMFYRSLTALLLTLLTISAVYAARGYSVGQENIILKEDMAKLMPPCMEQGVFKATAYEPSPRSTGKWARFGVTKTQTRPAAFRTVAVDPAIIPLETLIYVSNIGWAIAEDTGKAIKGNKVDVFMETIEEAMNFGEKEVVVYYQNKECLKGMVKDSKYSKNMEYLVLRERT